VTETNAINESSASPAEAPSGGSHAELQEQLKELRSTVLVSFAQAALCMMSVPRYRDQTLGDMERVILEPMVRDRIAIAVRVSPGEKSTQPVAGDLIGIAIWASVSDEVDAKIQQQIAAGVFPIRLGSGDWTSGTTVWLLDVIAPNPAMATAVLMSLGKVLPAPAAGHPGVRIHPIVRDAVGVDVLAKLGINKATTVTQGDGA
jgi:cytolysin-activating lysine-acyltransferase